MSNFSVYMIGILIVAGAWGIRKRRRRRGNRSVELLQQGIYPQLTVRSDHMQTPTGTAFGGVDAVETLHVVSSPLQSSYGGAGAALPAQPSEALPTAVMNDEL